MYSTCKSIGRNSTGDNYGECCNSNGLNLSAGVILQVVFLLGVVIAFMIIGLIFMVVISLLVIILWLAVIQTALIRWWQIYWL